MLGYITLGTNDLDAASRFYGSLFNKINVQRHYGCHFSRFCQTGTGGV